MEEFKNRMKVSARRFLIELYIEQRQSMITDKVQIYLREMTAKDIILMIENKQPFPVPPELIDVARKSSDILKTYRPDQLAQIVLEQINIARPDIFATIIAFGTPAAIWLVNNVQVCYDLITGSETPPVTPEPKMVRVTCSNCHQELIVSADKVINIKACPYCGKPSGGTNGGNNSPGAAEHTPNNGGQPSERPEGTSSSSNNG